MKMNILTELSMSHFDKNAEDTSQVRIDKIYTIIADCRYGIHDISRTELDKESGFPRFNMPLEFGVYLGAKKFGVVEQKAVGP